MKKLFRLLLLVSTVVWLSNCSMYHKPFPQEGGRFGTESDFVLQIDDHGSFWDPGIATKALRKIEEESKKTNTIVLLFIHGWHHNAQIDDENAIDFSSSLTRTRKVLNDNYENASGVYRKSREILTGNSEVKVIGIYVGWRGKALPMPLNYLTFWNRKEAAERVGQGDFREFLARLNQIYKFRSKERKTSKHEPFMGMVSIGHSFGGQVLFKAVLPTFENELIEQTSVYSEESPFKGIEGFGDIVVLVNPALEAFQYERIHKLNQLIEHDSSQMPRLLVLSSETDFARQMFFPLGRAADTMFRASFREQQEKLWTEALGEYEGQRTHEIELVTSPDSELFDPESYVSRICELVSYDLTNIPKIGGVHLTPTNNHKPNSPFLVAYASNDVIYKHSGIFKEELRRFINDYVAIAQGKQILLNSLEGRNCSPESTNE